MPTYQKFEDLPVWQASAELYDRVDDFIDRAPPRMRPGFRVKFEQAALSVSHNASAGYMRRGTDALPFLEAAHAASAEVQSMASIAMRQPYLKEFAAELGEIRKLGESCSRQLWGWAGKVTGGPSKSDAPDNRSTPSQQQPKGQPAGYQRRSAGR